VNVREHPHRVMIREIADYCRSFFNKEDYRFGDLRDNFFRIYMDGKTPVRYDRDNLGRGNLLINAFFYK
jgi:hypothetical protein